MPVIRMPALARAAIAAAVVLAAAAPAAASAAPPEATDPPQYVAMGDSYSAGVLVRPWDGRDGCGRSYRNYPHQVAEELGFDLVDKTCGAAEVVDGILEPQPPSKIHGPPSIPPDGGWRELPAQIAALSPDTDFTTVGIGGNSLGFGIIVTKCLQLGANSLGFGSPCTNYYTQGDGKDWLADKFAVLEADFGRMMTAIAEAAPNAARAVVGYPAIVPSRNGCTWGAFNQLGTTAKGDMPWLDGLERELNDMLADQAAQYGANYVDTYSDSVGHGVCEDKDTKWMYGVRDDITGEGDQTDPPSEECKKIPGSGEACTFVHPDAKGADNMARAVTRSLSE